MMMIMVSIVVITNIVILIMLILIRILMHMLILIIISFFTITVAIFINTYVSISYAQSSPIASVLTQVLPTSYGLRRLTAERSRISPRAGAQT